MRIRKYQMRISDAWVFVLTRDRGCWYALPDGYSIGVKGEWKIHER